MRPLPRALVHLLARPNAERRLGSFSLVRQLGRGGFAPVWLAEEMYGGKRVRDAAVKLFDVGKTSTQARDRLIQEAQALCRVDHPNVVRFYSLALDESIGVGGLAMELVAGPSLDQRIINASRLPAKEVIHIGATIASALAEVHRAGLLHRDIKPENIITTNELLKLIDFGIATEAELVDCATAVEEGDSDATERPLRGPVGTRGYMAPECQCGKAASVASDLYALGATLYSCLVGLPPAAARGGDATVFDAEVLSGHKAPPSITLFVPETEARLVEIIESLIEPLPENRPPNAEWVATRLRVLALEIAAPKKDLPDELTGGRASRRRWRVGVWVSMGIVFLVVGVLVFVRRVSWLEAESTRNLARAKSGLGTAIVAQAKTMGTVRQTQPGLKNAEQNAEQTVEAKPALNMPERTVVRRGVEVPKKVAPIFPTATISSPLPVADETTAAPTPETTPSTAAMASPSATTVPLTRRKSRFTPEKKR